MRLDDKDVEIIISTIENIFGKVEVYLFGSRLDDHKRGGDIDLFIVSEERSNLFEKKIKALSKLERTLYKPVDIVLHKDFDREIEKEILKNSLQLNRYNLNMQNLVSQIEAFLSNQDDVVFGYTFESWATGLQTEKSDVDLALYLQDQSLDNILNITHQLSKLVKKEVDLILLNSIKDIYLLDEIFNDGVVIKDDIRREDFELKKQHDILDYKAFRKMIDAA